MKSPFIVAIAIRSPYLFVAVAEERRVVEIRRYRVSDKSEAQLKTLIERCARRYAVSTVVTEAEGRAEALARTLGLEARTLDLAHAKRHLLGPSNCPSDLVGARFYSLLVARHPEFSRFVQVFPLTGRVAATERWRTGTLVVVTLALAAFAPIVPPTSVDDAAASDRPSA